MRIEKTSIISGVTRVVDLPVTQNQIDRWQGGMLIQDAMPQLDADQREFIMTGICTDEWHSLNVLEWCPSMEDESYGEQNKRNNFEDY